MELTFIGQMYGYNRWANERTLSSVASISTELFTRAIPSSFSSLRATLVHIVGAERLWLERWKGNSSPSLLAPDDFADVASLHQRWSAIQEELAAFLESLDQERLHAAFCYTNMKGQAFARPLWQVMLHVVNHGTYHRGQIVTMMRQLNLQAVSTDLLPYFHQGAK